MPFTIVRNDITKMKVDAIVNTANPRPVIGAGTDTAIHAAAGPRLLEARREIGDIAPGCSEATKAYDLPARYVLHTVGPAWRGGGYGEAELLRRAYDAALNLAGELKCRSVAFPLMAAGSYRFPRELALSVAIQAFTDYLLTHDLQIYLVLFNAEAFRLAGSLFDDLKSYVDDQYVSEQSKAEYAAPCLPRREDRDDRRESAARPAREYADEERCETDSDVSFAPNFGNNAAINQLISTTRPWRRKAKTAAAGSDAEPHAAATLKDYLGQTESTFTEFLLDLLNERGEKDSAVYHRAQMSRQLFNKIINKRDYQPTKNTAIQLAIGLRLDLSQTQKLLGKAGYALTRSSKSDLVVQYFILRGEYSIVAINTALYDCDLPLLTK